MPDWTIGFAVPANDVGAQPRFILFEPVSDDTNIEADIFLRRVHCKRANSRRTLQAIIRNNPPAVAPALVSRHVNRCAGAVAGGGRTARDRPGEEDSKAKATGRYGRMAVSPRDQMRSDELHSAPPTDKHLGSVR